MLQNDIKKVLVTHEEIVERSIELGKQITEDYKNNPPLVVALLKGSVPFLAELIQHIDLDIQYDFMDVSSYDGTESIGDIKIIKDLDSSIKFENNVYVSNYYNEIMLIDEANRYNDINVPYKNKLTNKLAVADNNCLFNKGDAFTINSYSSAFIKGMFSNKEEFNSNIIFK